MKLNLRALFLLFCFLIAATHAKAKITQPKFDREGIRKVFFDNNKALRTCFNNALNEDPKLNGIVKLDFDIVQNGSAQNAKVKDTSTLVNMTLNDCLIQNLKSWTFPKPPPSQIVNVIYPIAFAGK